MLPIKPHIWFSAPVKEAAEFYANLLPGSSVSFTGGFSMPNGECEIAEFVIAGQTFFGISSGPGLGINPSISFMINFDPSVDQDAAANIDKIWNKLTPEGKIMMPLDKYPFSERYGWVEDRYGVSWQLILSKPEGDPRPVIVPSLLYTPPVACKAGEAIDFYCSVFKKSKRGNTAPRPEDMGPDKAGTLMYADFFIDETWLAAMDSAADHGFNFNDAVSLLIPCETQDEIDHLWNSLSKGGQPGQCGWLKDKFGVSWQISSTVIFDTFKTGSQRQIDNVLKVFMGMQKVDIAALKTAHDL